MSLGRPVSIDSVVERGPIPDRLGRQELGDGVALPSRALSGARDASTDAADACGAVAHLRVAAAGQGKSSAMGSRSAGTASGATVSADDSVSRDRYLQP